MPDLTLITGTLSAFLVNDTICLVMTPLVLELVTAVRRNPRAKARGVEIGFWAYFRVGAPLSLITIVIGLLLL